MKIDVRRMEYDRIIERFDDRKILEQRFLADELNADDETSDADVDNVGKI